MTGESIRPPRVQTALVVAVVASTCALSACSSSESSAPSEQTGTVTANVAATLVDLFNAQVTAHLYDTSSDAAPMPNRLNRAAADTGAAKAGVKIIEQTVTYDNPARAWELPPFQVVANGEPTWCVSIDAANLAKVRELVKTTRSGPLTFSASPQAAALMQYSAAPGDCAAQKAALTTALAAP